MHRSWPRAPETSLDAFLLAEAFQTAGLPDGVFNLVTGGVDTGQALIAHPGIDKVSFTGSTEPAGPSAPPARARSRRSFR